MAYYINNIAAGDKYTDACTLGPFLDAKHAVVTVANNPALMQFAIGKQGAVRWTDEREFLSIPQSFKVGGICGVKFRNANPGQIARILAVLAGDEDPQFESGMPFTGTLTATGGIGVSFLGAFTLAQWPPQLPSQGAVADLADTETSLTPFAWPLENRPDIDAVEPWRGYNGETLPYSIFESINSGVTGSVQDIGTFVIPAPGLWHLEMRYVGSAAGAASSGSLGLTATGHELLGPLVPAGGQFAASGSVEHTFTAGQVVHVSVSQSSGVTSPYVAVFLRPVKLNG